MGQQQQPQQYHQQQQGLWKTGSRGGGQVVASIGGEGHDGVDRGGDPDNVDVNPGGGGVPPGIGEEATAR